MINSSPAIKIIVADDHVLRRQGLVSLLRTRPEFLVIREVSGEDDLDGMSSDLLPDIVIVDRDFPTKDHQDPAIAIHRWKPHVRVLILADHLSYHQAIGSFRNGAGGYLVRTEDFDRLCQAIFTVNTGKRYLSQQITDQVLDSVIVGEESSEESQNNISPREREILQLVAEGKTNAEIGKLLVISTRTVETHRNNLMRKLGLSSQIEIIRYAIKKGIVSIE